MAQGIIPAVACGTGDLNQRGARSDLTGLRIVSEWQTAQSVVIRPRGELDLDSTFELRRELFGVIEHGAATVVVDLGATVFIDSMTIGILLKAVRRLQERGGELRIACTDPNITRIFEITLLDRVFAIYPSCEAALGSTTIDR